MYTKIPASQLCSVKLSTKRTKPISSASKVLEPYSSHRTSGPQLFNKWSGYMHIALANLMHWGFADQRISSLFSDQGI